MGGAKLIINDSFDPAPRMLRDDERYVILCLVSRFRKESAHDSMAKPASICAVCGVTQKFLQPIRCENAVGRLGRFNESISLKHKRSARQEGNCYAFIGCLAKDAEWEAWLRYDLERSFGGGTIELRRRTC